MRSLAKIAVYIFSVIGLVFTIGAAIIGVNLWMQLHGDDRRNDAKISDVSQFFHWSSIPVPSQLSVMESYFSRRSYGGDHLDAVCIKVTEAPHTPEWLEIDALERSFQEAVGMAVNWASSEISCFPDLDATKRLKMVVLVESVKFARGSPQSAFIALSDRSRNMVFFVSFKV